MTKAEKKTSSFEGTFKQFMVEVRACVGAETQKTKTNAFNLEYSSLAYTSGYPNVFQIYISCKLCLIPRLLVRE